MTDLPSCKIFFLIVSNSNPSVLYLNGFWSQLIFGCHSARKQVFSLFMRDSPFLVNEISCSILSLSFFNLK